MKKKSKKYLEVLKMVEKNKLYLKEEAIKLVKKTTTTNFDASVEISIRLNLDSKLSDQQVRGAMVLPNGTGKSQKVLVLAKADKAKEATAAGADYVGEADFIEKIEKENWFDFDVIVATPEMMASLGKIGKVLGPKGLMPNPKTGTVTNDVKKAVEDIKKGKVEYRTDDTSNIHVIIGKVSFTEKKLLENFDALLETIMNTRPATVKGDYLKSISLSTTMGPGIKVDLNSFDK